MADLSELEIRTLVDEIDIGDVKAGLRIESTVEAFANMGFEGEVMKIEPQAVVQQSVTTFPVLSRIDNSHSLLLPGMNADVSIIIQERSNVLTVSNEAVRSPEDAREVIQLLGLDAPVDVLQSSLVTSLENPTQPASASMREPGDLANGNSDNGHADSRETVTKAHPVGDISGDNDSRQEPAVVFVLDIDGRFHAREIVTGVRDWETSEVLAGLEEGEELVLLPSTSLLRSQQDIRDRFARQNTVVSLPGQ